MNKRYFIIPLISFSLFLTACNFNNSTNLEQTTTYTEASLEDFTHLHLEIPDDLISIETTAAETTTDITTTETTTIPPTTVPPTTVPPTTAPPTTVPPTTAPPTTVPPTTAPLPSGYYNETYQIRNDALALARSNMNTYAAYMNKIVQITNQYRAEAGVPPLTMDTTLNTIASYKSAEMVVLKYFAHERGDLQFDSVFYGFDYGGFTMGENIAYGYPSPEAVCTGWRNSEGHYQNMISTYFTTIGIGVAKDENGVLYWTQEFGE